MITKTFTPEALKAHSVMVEKFSDLLIQVATTLSERDNLDQVCEKNVQEAWNVLAKGAPTK